MPEVRRDRFLGKETMKITVIGFFAIATAIIAAVLLILHVNKASNKGPEQSHA